MEIMTETIYEHANIINQLIELDNAVSHVNNKNLKAIINEFINYSCEFLSQTYQNYHFNTIAESINKAACGCKSKNENY